MQHAKATFILFSDWCCVASYINAKDAVDLLLDPAREKPTHSIKDISANFFLCFQNFISSFSLSRHFSIFHSVFTCPLALFDENFASLFSFTYIYAIYGKW